MERKDIKPKRADLVKILLELLDPAHVILIFNTKCHSLSITAWAFELKWARILVCVIHQKFCCILSQQPATATPISSWPKKKSMLKPKSTNPSIGEYRIKTNQLKRFLLKKEWEKQLSISKQLIVFETRTLPRDVILGLCDHFICLWCTYSRTTGIKWEE